MPSNRIEIFKLTGRPIIPIDVGGALTRLEWKQTVKGVPVSEDAGVKVKSLPDEVIKETEENLQSGQPSELVVGRVAHSFQYTKRIHRQRFMFATAFVLLLVSFVVVAASVDASWNAKVQEVLAEQNAQAAQDTADKAAREAKSSELQQLEALRSRAAAQTAAAEAVAEKKLADQQAMQARDRETVAIEREAQASANAKKQETIASSLERVSTAAKLVSTNPDWALGASAAAYRQYPSVEARSSLLNNLQYYPHLKKIQRGHLSKVSSIAYCQHGRIQVTVGAGDIGGWGGIQGGLIFWDVKTGRQVSSFLSPGAFPQSKISCLADGNLCASNEEAEIVLWDIAIGGQGSSVNRRNSGIKLQSQSYERAFELVNDETIALAGADGDVDLWSLKRPTDPPRALKTGCSSAPTEIVVNLAKTKLAVGCAEGIALLDISSGNAGFVMVDFPPERQSDLGKYESLSFSDDGKLLAVGISDRLVFVVDVPQHKLLQEFVDNGGASVAFGHALSSRALAIANQQGVSVWLLDANGKGGTPYFRLTTPQVSSLTFAPGSSEMLVTGLADGTLAGWEISRKNPLGKQLPSAQDVTAFVFNDRGDRLLAYGAGGKRSLWQVKGDQVIPLSSTEDSSDSSKGRFPRFVESINKGDVVFRDPLSHTSPLLSVHLPSGAIRMSPTLSGDEKLLATIYSGTAQIWDITHADKPDLIKKIEHAGYADRLALSRDGKILAIGYQGGTILLWDIVKRKELRTLISPFGAPTINNKNDLTALAFSFDAATIASSSSQRRIDLWDTGTGKLIGSLDFMRVFYADQLLFTPNGEKLIAHGGSEWIVWDVGADLWVKRALEMANQ